MAVMQQGTLNKIASSRSRQLKQSRAHLLGNGCAIERELQMVAQQGVLVAGVLVLLPSSYPCLFLKQGISNQLYKQLQSSSSSKQGLGPSKQQ